MTEVSEILLLMYKDIKKILDKHGITFYIQYGTAIGALRHNGLIPWDDDIDILVWEKDMDEINRVRSGKGTISNSRSKTEKHRS